MNEKYISTLIIICVFLSACGPSAHMQYREKYLSSNPGIPQLTQQRIRQGKIAIGMTKAQVVAAWGNHCIVCYGNRRTNNYTVWVYNPMGPSSLGIGASSYLYFNNKGILVRWSIPKK